MVWNFLETEEQTIGTHYAIRIKRTLFLLKICYDDRFSACSPGMVERGTPHHQLGKTEAIESLTLHETSGEPLLASAWIQPELRLDVEVNGTPFGARTAESLLDHWAAIVTALAVGVAIDAETITALPSTMRDTLSHWEPVANHQRTCIWQPHGALRRRPTPGVARFGHRSPP